MKILAIDLSGDIGSLVWVNNGCIQLVKEWKAERRQSRPVFADLMAWVRDGAVDPAGIDRLSVGVGPGAFSGLRAAVTMVRALALPGNTPVTAVSSARALAMQVFRETGAAQVVVIGDARRNEVWAGGFTMSGGVPGLQGDWVVVPAAQLPCGMGQPGTVWVSADWERLGPVLTTYRPPEVELLAGARRSHASMVAALAEVLAEKGLAGEPPVPIYVHPAVSIAPKY